MWVPLVAIPLVEYLLLTTAVDAAELTRLPVTRNLGMVGAFAICLATCLFLVGGRDLSEALVTARRDDTPWSHRWSALASHFASYGLFFCLTVSIARSSPPATSLPDAALFFAWLGLAMMTASTWAILALPPALRRWAATHGPRAVGVALAIAGAAVAMGLAFERSWRFLARGTLFVAEGALSLGSGRHWSDETTDAPTLGIDDFHVQIAPECSGVEGMGLMLVLVSAYLLLFRRELRFPRALAALPIGLGAAFVGNGLRIAALVWVGRYVSVEIALRGFHSKAGWVAFCAVALALISLTRRFSGRAETRPIALVEGPVGSYIGAELALLATALFTGLFTIGPDRLHGLRILAALPILFASRRILRGALSPSMAPIAVGVLVYAAWWWLAGETTSGPVLEAFLSRLSPAERYAWVGTHVLGSVLVIPIVEELAFRGFAMRWADARAFDEVNPRAASTRAILLSSLAFGALHSSFIAATLAGIAYAFVYRRRGQLGDAILAHAVTNALIAAEVLAFGHYGRW